MQQRQTTIDLLKTVAAQVILLHHLSVYGPLAGVWDKVANASSNFFYDEGRLAVQVFLVIGGFLAARSLTARGVPSTAFLWRTLTQRYRRLVLPFAVALVLAVLSSLLSRQWLTDDFIPAAPNWGQALAHLALMHGVLDEESLSAGAWYVAVDFQLFATLALLLCLSPRRWGGRLLVTALTLASLFYFNLHAKFDAWSVYFFGAYGLGAAAYWVDGGSGVTRRPATSWMMLALTGCLALIFEFRSRIALAFVVALLLGAMQWRNALGMTGRALSRRLSAGIARLGQTAYALFLVHFSVLMLGNAVYAHYFVRGFAGWSSEQAGCGLLATCWAVSLILGWAFERYVERPLAGRSLSGRRPALLRERTMAS